jgi:hypothetical protein
MNAADEAVLFDEGFVGRRAISRVCPDRRRRVCLVEQALAQPRPFVSGGVGCGPRADEAEAPINRQPWKRRMAEDGQATVAADETVVGASKVRELEAGETALKALSR